MSWTLTLRGVTVGTGTAWPFIEAPALFGIDSPRSNDALKPYGWGSTTHGPDLPSSRDISFSVWSNLLSESAALAALQTFQGAYGQADETLELTVSTPSQDFIVYGRPRRSIPNLENVGSGIIGVAVQFRALDPRFYDATPTSTTVPLGAISGGLAYPFAYPFAYGTASAGTATLNNLGNAPTSLKITIAPTSEAVTDPVVVNQTTGERVEFESLTISPGRSLEIDFAERTVTLIDPFTAGGSVDVSSTIDRTVSTWWTGSGVLATGSSTVTTVAGGNNASVSYLFRSAFQL